MPNINSLKPKNLKGFNFKRLPIRWNFTLFRILKKKKEFCQLNSNYYSEFFPF